MATILNRVENCLTLIAYASLKHWNEPTNFDNIEAEKARITRVAEPFYVNCNQDYNEFLLSWLKTNAHEIVYEDTFTYDNLPPDNSFELNINSFIKN